MITLNSIILKPKDNRQLSAPDIYQPAGLASSTRMTVAHTALTPSPTLILLLKSLAGPLWSPAGPCILLSALPRTYEATLPLSVHSGPWLMSDLAHCPLQPAGGVGC